MQTPNQSDHYRRRAEECVELAHSVSKPEHRVMLQHIAETWLRLAADARPGNGEQRPAVSQ